MEFWSSLLVFVVAWVVVGVLIAGVPLTAWNVRRFYRFPLEVVATSIDPDELPDSERARSYLAESSEVLSRLGFVLDSHYLIPEFGAPWVYVHQVVFRNERARVRAVVGLMHAGDRFVARGSYVLFNSILSATDDLETVSLVDPYPPLKNRVAFQWPGSTIEELYSIHGVSFDRLTGGSRPTLPPAAEYLEELNEELEELFSKMDEHGWMVRVEDAGEYRPTWRFAFYSALDESRPIRWILHLRTRRRTRRHLAKLGVDY